MAKDAKPAAEGEQAAAPKKSKKLLIIIIAAVLVVVLGAGAAFMVLKKSGDEEASDDEDAVETSKSKKKDKKKEAHAPAFIAIDPFTVNLVPEGSDQYLQVALSMEIEDPTLEPTIKTSMPKLRNDITLLLTSKKASELLSKDGKEALAHELKDAINDVLEPPKRNKKGEKVSSEDGPVKEVLFTSFIIQ